MIVVVVVSRLLHLLLLHLLLKLLLDLLLHLRRNIAFAKLLTELLFNLPLQFGGKLLALTTHLLLAALGLPLLAHLLLHLLLLHLPLHHALLESHHGFLDFFFGHPGLGAFQGILQTLRQRRGLDLNALLRKVSRNVQTNAIADFIVFGVDGYVATLRTCLAGRQSQTDEQYC